LKKGKKILELETVFMRNEEEIKPPSNLYRICIFPQYVSNSLEAELPVMEEEKIRNSL
jgi:hypothetical protein